MAPEFIPFFVFIGLAVALLCLSVIFIACVYKKKQKHLYLGSAVFLAAFFIVSIMLVVLGAKIRQQYFLNEPLVCACGEGDFTEVQRLLASGASPNAYGIDFVQTALIAAAQRGHIKIVALLLRNGAKVDLEDSSGKTALQRAEEANQHEIVTMLKKAETDESNIDDVDNANKH